MIKEFYERFADVYSAPETERKVGQFTMGIILGGAVGGAFVEAADLVANVPPKMAITLIATPAISTAVNKVLTS